MRSLIQELMGTRRQSQFDSSLWKSVPFAYPITPDMFFWKDESGLVHFEQRFYTVTNLIDLPAGTLMTTLPQGYRPPNLVYISVGQYFPSGPFSHKQADIDIDGTIHNREIMSGSNGSGSSATFMLHSPNYRAEG